MRIAAPLVAGLFLSACFDSEPEKKKPSDWIAEKNWTFQSVTHDVGEWRGNAAFFSGSNMLAMADSATPDTGLAGILFPSGRSCYYGAEWENPGSCLQDDIWDFSPNGSLTRNSGTTLCDSTQPAVETGTWSVGSGQVEFRMSLGGDTAVFQIETATGSALRLSETTVDSTTLCGKTVLVNTVYSFVSP